MRQKKACGKCRALVVGFNGCWTCMLCYPIKKRVVFFNTYDTWDLAPRILCPKPLTYAKLEEAVKCPLKDRVSEETHHSVSGRFSTNKPNFKELERNEKWEDIK